MGAADQEGRVRTYAVSLNPPKALPRSAHDPKWRIADSAATMSLFAYHRSRLEARSGALTPVAELPEPPRDSDQRRFVLLEPVEAAGLGVHFKGGGFGELHRRYAPGGGRPAVDFHAQSVCFGADSEGRYFLSAEIGRVFGLPGDRVTVVARFRAGSEVLGGVSWQGPVDHVGNQRIEVGGRDPVLAAMFDRLMEIDAQFWVDTRLPRAPFKSRRAGWRGTHR
jgi:hypothetical protein